MGVSFSVNDLPGNIYIYGYALGSAMLLFALTGTAVANQLGRKGGFFLAWALIALGSGVFQWTKQAHRWSLLPTL